MQSAPPVQVLIPPSRGWRWVQAGIGALAGATVAVWLGDWSLTVEGPARPDALIAVLGAALGGVLLWTTSRANAVELIWDGRGWACRIASPAGVHALQDCQVRVAWDAGSALLLRLDIVAEVSAQRSELRGQMQEVQRRPLPQGGLPRVCAGKGWASVWVVAARDRLQGDWHLLRLALYTARP